MPILPDIHTLSADKKYVAAQPLVTRLMDILEITGSTNRRDFAKTHVVTAGFTIQQVAQVLPPMPPAVTSSGTPELLGWLFIFPTLQVNNPNQALMANISVNQLLMTNAGGSILMSGDVPLIHNAAPVSIRPKIYYQLDPALQATDYDSSYPVSFDHIKPGYVDDPLLHVSRLDDYETWAELALYGRGDLDLMKAYFDAGFNAYNDIFFSGARVNYHTMHNPKLRVQQKTFVSPVTGTTVPGTSSNAFTLKAEPYILLNDNVSKGTASPPVVLGGGGATAEKDAAPTVASPMVGLMDPCPDYWDFIGSVSTELAYVEPQVNPEQQLRVASALLSLDPMELLSAGPTSPLTIPGVSIAPLPPPKKDFFDWLRDRWNDIRRFILAIINPTRKRS